MSFIALVVPPNHPDWQQEYTDVQMTAYLAALTKSTNVLNDVCGFPPSSGATAHT